MAMTNSAGPGVLSLTGQVCLDADTENAAFQSGPMTQPKSCGEPKFAPDPSGGLMFDSVCKTDGRRVEVHAALSGDFNNAYAMDITSRVSPSVQGMPSEFRTHTEARWLGPCKPGQTPGHIAFKLSGFGRD